MEIPEFTKKEDELMARIREAIKKSGRSVTGHELMGQRLVDWRFWIGDVVLYLHELKNFTEDIEAEAALAVKRRSLPPPPAAPRMPSSPLVKLEPLMVAGVPRRNRIDLNTPAELAIRDAVSAVEKVGAHPILTDAVMLLSQALDKVADYVDAKHKPVT